MHFLIENLDAKKQALHATAEHDSWYLAASMTAIVANTEVELPLLFWMIFHHNVFGLSKKQLLLTARNHNAALLGDMLEQLMREALRCLVGSICETYMT